MKMIHEKLLHYIWQFQLMNRSHLRTIEGNEILVKNPGTLNSNQGPDFLNAKIIIDDACWVGSVELHIKSTDWNLHKHSEDRNYKNVILHVVWKHDRTIHLPFPTLELCQLVPKLVIERYYSLMHHTSFIPCENLLKGTSPIVIEKWKERMMVERLEHKAADILSNLKALQNNWEECCCLQLFKTFGGNINGESFVEICRVVNSHKIIFKEFDAFRLEAIFMGVGGLLNADNGDESFHKLKSEYHYLSKKYRLSKGSIQLSFLRMRPTSFPTIRLSQLSQFFSLRKNIFQSLIDCNRIEEFNSFFKVKASAYWDTHFVFNEPSAFFPKYPGKETLSNLIINVAVPVTYAYAKYYGSALIKNKAIDFLVQLHSEANSVSRRFIELGFLVNTAFDSQAVLHLKNEYCNYKKCLDCSIGYYILNNKKEVKARLH